MDLTKRYFTKEGKPCDILLLVMKEPEWAANRIQSGEKAEAALADKDAAFDRLKDQYMALQKDKEKLIKELAELREKVRLIFNSPIVSVTELKAALRAAVR